MNVSTARDWVVWAARHASDTSQYSTADRDRAIQFVITDFARRVRLGMTRSSVTLTSGNPAVNLSSISGFRAERILRAWIGTKPALMITDYQTILDSRNQQDYEDTPQAIGFWSATDAEVWPTPDTNDTMYVLWNKPPTLWTVGDAGAGSTVIDVPDDYLVQILTLAGPAMLQHNEPEHAFATTSWQQYLEYVSGFTGSGTGTLVAYRDRPE